MRKEGPMFRITGKKGFHITFENGWTVSVQFGPGNYCENYKMEIGRDDEEAGRLGSAKAECAVFHSRGELYEHPMFKGDTVGGYMSPKQVLELMNWAAAQTGDIPKQEGEDDSHISQDR